MIFRLYVDEVGNADLKGAASDANIRYLSLTATLASIETHTSLIQPQFDDLKIKHFGDKNVILHRRDIVKKTGPFAILEDETKKEEFNLDLLHLFDSLPYRAITVSIDKKDHLSRYSSWHFDPYHYCMCCLIERYVTWLNRHNFVGDIMAESRFPKVDKKLKASYRHIWNNGTPNVSSERIQKRLTSREIKLSPKTENVAAVQMSDLLASPSFVGMLHEKNGTTPPNDFGAKVRDILHLKKYQRCPKTYKISGYGKKWLP